jgi:hypothetical protein
MWTSTTQVMAGVLFFKADPAHAGIQRIIDAIELLAGSPLARGRTSIARTRPHEPLHHRVQSTAIDLAIRVARNVRDVDEPYGNIPLREPVAAVLLQRLLVLPAVRHDKRPDFINAEPNRYTERRRRRAARSTWQASERTWAATGLHNEGHGRPWPGHPRLACRHKAGHDSVGGLHSSWAAWPAMMAQSWVPVLRGDEQRSGAT